MPQYENLKTAASKIEFRENLIGLSGSSQDEIILEQSDKSLEAFLESFKSFLLRPQIQGSDQIRDLKYLAKKIHIELEKNDEFMEKYPK